MAKEILGNFCKVMGTHTDAVVDDLWYSTLEKQAKDIDTFLILMLS